MRPTLLLPFVLACNALTGIDEYDIARDGEADGGDEAAPRDAPVTTGCKDSMDCSIANHVCAKKGTGAAMECRACGAANTDTLQCKGGGVCAMATGACN